MPFRRLFIANAKGVQAADEMLRICASRTTCNEGSGDGRSDIES
jgi:hypothetical protein